jgi:capsular polysaccharide biosynthesis protein
MGQRHVSEQAVDLRSSLAILRRNRGVLAGAAALGLAAGVAFVLLRPAKFTSTSLVLLPPPVQNSSGQTTSRGVDTEVRIAHSDVVLGPAGKKVTPRLTANALSPLVHVKAPTTEVIQIKASAETPLVAQELSKAVADSYVTYVKEAASSLSSAQQAGLNQRLTALQDSLSSVQSEVKKTTARAKNEDPTSASGKADATALAQLTAQQSSLALQIDQVKEEATAGRQPLDSQTGASASVIQQASPAVRPVLAERLAVFALLGILIVVMLAALLLMTLGRRDRKLRSRDEIADALGSAVIASIRSRVPKGVSGWAALLEGYTPGTVDAWALRQALRQLVLGDSALGSRQDHGLASLHQMSITVISLADDRRGLAMGPQLASFAAASGISTRLVGGQRHESAAALWTACSSVGPEDEVRAGLVVDTHGQRQTDVELTIVMVVVDRRKPELIALPDTTVTVLAVASGSATAEDLARTAVTADDAGSRIDGILVADPDKLDRSTGRLSHQERLQQVVLPTRLTGISSPSDGTPSNVTGLRRGLS